MYPGDIIYRTVPWRSQTSEDLCTCLVLDYYFPSSCITWQPHEIWPDRHAHLLKTAHYHSHHVFYVPENKTNSI